VTRACQEQEASVEGKPAQAIGSKKSSNFWFQNAGSAAFAEGWEGKSPGSDLPKKLVFLRSLLP
jgi:hypothetical protein